MAHTHGEETLHRPHAGAAEEALIRFDNFCFAYETEPVLSHISLEIRAGESVVLMGDNGSGKSTLLRAISGLIHPQEGSYFFRGELVNEKSMRDTRFAKALHARVGFVFQDSDAQLFCPSVEAELAFGPLQMGLSDTEVEARISDALELLSIGSLRERAPWTLSGGEKRRVAIASVLTMNPEILCLDEPLAGLDAATSSWLADFLLALKEAGKTLIVATHDQSLADRVADYFVYMGEYHGYDDRPHTHINIRTAG